MSGFEVTILKTAVWVDTKFHVVALGYFVISVELLHTKITRSPEKYRIFASFLISSINCLSRHIKNMKNTHPIQNIEDNLRVESNNFCQFVNYKKKMQSVLPVMTYNGSRTAYTSADTMKCLASRVHLIMVHGTSHTSGDPSLKKEIHFFYFFQKKKISIIY